MALCYTPHPGVLLRAEPHQTGQKQHIACTYLIVCLLLCCCCRIYLSFTICRAIHSGPPAAPVTFLAWTTSTRAWTYVWSGVMGISKLATASSCTPDSAPPPEVEVATGAGASQVGTSRSPGFASAVAAWHWEGVRAGAILVGPGVCCSMQKCGGPAGYPPLTDLHMVMCHQSNHIGCGGNLLCCCCRVRPSPTFHRCMHGGPPAAPCHVTVT